MDSKKTVSKKARECLENCDAEIENKEDTFCLVCAESYSNSKPCNTLIQCSTCKGLSHEDYDLITSTSSYKCQNCDSDDAN